MRAIAPPAPSAWSHLEAYGTLVPAVAVLIGLSALTRWVARDAVQPETNAVHAAAEHAAVGSPVEYTGRIEAPEPKQKTVVLRTDSGVTVTVRFPDHDLETLTPGRVVTVHGIVKHASSASKVSLLGLTITPR